MIDMPTARFACADPDERTRARLRYAFSAYAALYGIRVVDGPSADVSVVHGDTREHADVRLPAGYRLRPASEPAPAPSRVDGMPCFHPTPTGEPDVLGEVFEWLSAQHELSCTTLDDVGRVPPEHTLAGTHGIDRTIPWVNRWLARLHASIRSALPGLPIAPPSPLGAGNTFVASHDIDHLSADRLVNARRLVRNVGIALVHERSPRTGLQITATAAQRVLRRRTVINGLDELLRGEAERGVHTTYTVITDGTHRRDPGYRLDEPAVREALDRIAADGHELAVHGSYRSLELPGQLAREYALLADAGHQPTGGRQHWLRHRGPELFAALEAAGAQWDSTRGHPDVVGFRHGAAFPFLPYDLERERPHDVVEIPLVVMERALSRVTDQRSAWPTIATDVLRAAGDDGWGGVAVLWHDDAVSGATGGRGFDDAYWAVLDAGDRWVTAAEVATAARRRWDAAGCSARATGIEGER